MIPVIQTRASKQHVDAAGMQLNAEDELTAAAIGVSGKCAKNVQTVRVIIMFIEWASNPSAWPDFNPIEFDGIGNCGEFATIRNRADGLASFLIPSNSTELESRAATVSHI